MSLDFNNMPSTHQHEANRWSRRGHEMKSRESHAAAVVAGGAEDT